MEDLKNISTLYHFIKYDLCDELEQFVETIDLEDIGIALLESGSSYDYGEDSYVETLQKYIAVLNYIETETSVPTTVSDDTYDRLVEVYKDLGGTQEIGVQGNTSSSSKKFGYHKYPELRGSLSKIHYLKNDEIPKKDSRKSFQYFVSNVMRELSSQDVNVSGDITITVDFKWDGVSHVFEMNDGATINRVLTRYDVDNNLGVDITHIFKNCDLSKLLFSPLPKNITEAGEFGLKVETFMPTKYFDQYVSDMEDGKCNRRSAITSITNKGEDEYDPSLIQYLAVKPLQISTTNYIDVSGDDGWIYIGQLFGHHQYIHIYSLELAFKVTSLSDLLNNLDKYPLKDSIDVVREMAGNVVPIDGAVMTIVNDDIINALGRSDNKNKFQVAFKFPQGVKKTKLKEVQFPVGPVAGAITPLAIVEPVVINGNTITNATLSNFDKLERLDLNIGDDVIIKYDIIPKIEKDDSCKKGTGQKVIRLTNCPICDSDLQGGSRCINPDCPAKLAGKIYNYIKKMKIKGIGKKTIEKFVDRGWLGCLGDMYRLPDKMKSITTTPGFGVVSFTNMLSSIFGKTQVYPHELLGAIGIPDVSIKTMKKVCQEMDIATMSTEQLIASVPEMTSIRGIGDITAWKIVDGLVEKMDDIEDIIQYIEFREYPKERVTPDEVVLFTECRDADFAEYLESINIEVASSYVKALTILIVSDELDIDTTSNKKVEKAKAAGLPILRLSEAKQRFGY